MLIWVQKRKRKVLKFAAPEAIPPLAHSRPFMKKHPIALIASLPALLLCGLLLMPSLSIAQSTLPPRPAAAQSGQPALIPMPRKIAWQNGAANLSRAALEIPPSETFLRAEATRVLREYGVALDPNAPLKIRFRIAPAPDAPADNKEAYALNVAPGGIEVTAPQSKGLLYGWQTLRQMLQRRGGITFAPAARITDWPAYAWRGFMHDVGRNPQDVATLKRFADLMARYKYNVYHLHLSDSPGYRVQSRAFPQLNDPKFQEKTRRPGFVYTYAQLKDIIAYCRERGIDVVPEIDMPGHSAYFKRAFGFEMQDPRGVEIMKKVVGEFLDEIQTTYFHMGGDEVHLTNPGFINEMADFIRGRGRKILVWRPGNLPSGEYIVQRWPNGAQDNSAPPGIAQVDSRHNYINHMDALIAPLRMLTLQPGDVPESTPLVLGATLCMWNDNALANEMELYRQNPVLPATLAGAERYWRSGDKVDWKHVSMFPLPSDPFYPVYQEFEPRLIAHRDVIGREWPFPYVANSNIPWKLLGPIDNGGDSGKVFPPETELRDSYDINGKTYTWSDAIGGTIHINHFFDYPGWLPKAGSGTAFGYTNLWSPRAQTVGFWIGFNSYSRSAGRRGGPNPDIGQWTNTGSEIWINNKAVPPPTWKNPKMRANSEEIPLVDEDYFYRPPTQVALKQGWNRILIKAPRNSPAWKWQFTFVPVQIVDGVPHEVPDLKFSTELQPKPGSAFPGGR